MIKLLYDTTINGFRVLKGSLIDLDTATEATLIEEGDATRDIGFASANLLPRCIYQNHAPLTLTADGSASDTSGRNAGSFTVRGGTMNLNGELVILSSFDATPDAATTTKTITLLWGGSNVGGPAFTGTGSKSIEIQTRIKNCNSLTTQKIHNQSSFGAASSIHVTANKDTAGDVTFQLTGKWGIAAATETLVQVGLSCWYYPGPT